MKKGNLPGPDDLMVELGPKGRALLAELEERDRQRPGEPDGVWRARVILARGADQILMQRWLVAHGYVADPMPAKHSAPKASYGLCKGILRDGRSCRAVASLPSGYCRVHAPKARQSPEKAPRKPAPAATAPRAARAAQRRLEADAARAARKAQRDARRAEERSPVAGQCSGLTKLGRRCRLMADGDDGRCALHQDRAL